MIPVPDRIATCLHCERKEHIRCPELDCNNCLCRKCFDLLDKNIVNRIEPKETSEVEILSHRKNGCFFLEMVAFPYGSLPCLQVSLGLFACLRQRDGNDHVCRLITFNDSH